MYYLQQSNNELLMKASCFFKNFIHVNNVTSSYLPPTPSLQLPQIPLTFIICPFKNNTLNQINNAHMFMGVESCTGHGQA